MQLCIVAAAGRRLTRLPRGLSGFLLLHWALSSRTQHKQLRVLIALSTAGPLATRGPLHVKTTRGPLHVKTTGLSLYYLGFIFSFAKVSIIIKHPPLLERSRSPPACSVGDPRSSTPQQPLLASFPLYVSEVSINTQLSSQLMP